MCRDDRRRKSDLQLTSRPKPASHDGDHRVSASGWASALRVILSIPASHDREHRGKLFPDSLCQFRPLPELFSARAQVECSRILEWFVWFVDFKWSPIRLHAGGNEV